MSGWDNIMGGLNQMGNAWEKANQYSQIDIAKTLSNLFKGNKQEQSNELPDISQNPSPNRVDLPDVSQNPAKMLSQSGQPNTREMLEDGNFAPKFNNGESDTGGNSGMGGQESFDVSQLSANNPYRQHIPANTGIVHRTVRPETLLAAQQWEQENQRNQYINDLSKLDYESKKNSFITLTPEILAQLPESKRGLYQSGQTVPRSEIIGMIPEQTTPEFTYDANTVKSFASGLSGRNAMKSVFATFGPNTPADVIKDAMDQAIKIENDLNNASGSGKDNSKTYVEQMDASYKDFLKGHPIVRNSQGQVTYQPPTIEAWIRTKYGEEKARQYLAESSGNSDMYNRPTTASKFGTAQYKPSNKYTDTDWWTIDEKVKNAGSFAQIAKQMLSSKAISPAYREVLAARSGLTVAQLVQKYGTVVKTGTLNGKKVIYYADGTAIAQ